MMMRLQYPKERSILKEVFLFLSIPQYDARRCNPVCCPLHRIGATNRWIVEADLHPSAAAATDTDTDDGISHTLTLSTEHSGHALRCSVLQEHLVLVFDFGAELYVWTGRSASHQLRAAGKRLARQLWSADYDYSDCGVSPIDGSTDKLTGKRPDWGICGRVGQNMETFLFKEKFIDWVDNSKTKATDNSESAGSDRTEQGQQQPQQQQQPLVSMEPCDALALFNTHHPPCSLLLERHNLSRGRDFYDDEEMRLSVVDTLSLCGWRVSEASGAVALAADSQWLGQMNSGATYVWRWRYKVTVTARALGGGTSRHEARSGRDRCAYFFWQGRDSTVNEKGAAALAVVELDTERSPHVRVPQGREPAAFLNLFDGRMIVYSDTLPPPAVSTADGGEGGGGGRWRMFVVCGSVASECHMLEVAVSAASLRPRAACLLLHTGSGRQLLWLGAELTHQLHQLAVAAADRLRQLGAPSEMAMVPGVEVGAPEKIRQGEESGDFTAVLVDWQQYSGHLCPGPGLSQQQRPVTPRLFRFTVGSGQLTATLVPCPHAPPSHTSSGTSSTTSTTSTAADSSAVSSVDNSSSSSSSALWCPLPYTQSELYEQQQQPALLLLDAGHSGVYVWQGWRPVSHHQPPPPTPSSSHSTPASDEAAAAAAEDDNVGGGGGGKEESAAAATENGQVAAENFRWHHMRRCVFATAVQYGRLQQQQQQQRGASDDSVSPERGSEGGSEAERGVQLVVAGLEPPHFRHLFPEWRQHDEAAQLNQQEGYSTNEVLSVDDQLSLLSRQVYPLSVLRSRPLPDAVDPARLEQYLSDAQFQEELKMSKEEFATLPLWKQTNLKKTANLF